MVLIVQEVVLIIGIIWEPLGITITYVRSVISKSIPKTHQMGLIVLMVGHTNGTNYRVKSILKNPLNEWVFCFNPSVQIFSNTLSFLIFFQSPYYGIL